ncbi:MAG: hypothetical protein ACRCS3_14585 [Paracoccaceae bacterium]
MRLRLILGSKQRRSTMRKTITAILFTIAGATAALATNEVERAIYVATDGTRYIWNSTEDGTIFVAPESALAERYLMTPDCVVQNATYGKGAWGVEDGGWQISFGLRLQIYFPGPMPPVDAANCLLLR